MNKWIAMAAAVTLSGYALAQIAPNQGNNNQPQNGLDPVLVAQAGPGGPETAGPDGAGPGGGGPGGAGPGGHGGGPGGGPGGDRMGGGMGGPGGGFPNGPGGGDMMGGGMRTNMQEGPRGGLMRGGNGPVQQMRDYVDLIDKYGKLAADPDASAVSAVISAGEILRPKGAPAAIEYYTKLLPQARSEVVQRAIRLQLIDLYKQSNQPDKALEQIEILVKPSASNTTSSQPR